MSKKEVKVQENKTVSSLELKRDKYTLLGWYTDNQTFKNEYVFNLPVTQNFSLYAKWSEPEKTDTEKFKERLKKNEESKTVHSTISGQYSVNGEKTKTTFTDKEIKNNKASIDTDIEILVKYDTKSFEELCPVEDKEAIYIEGEDYFQLSFDTKYKGYDAFVVLGLDNDNYLKWYDISYTPTEQEEGLAVEKVTYK